MAVGEQTEKLDVSAGLKSSQEKASVSLANSEIFFCLCLCFLGEALNRRSLFLIFQSQFSLLTAPLSLSSQLFLPLCLVFYIYFGQITFSSFCSHFDFHLFFSPSITLQQTDGQKHTGQRYKVPSRSHSEVSARAH